MRTQQSQQNFGRFLCSCSAKCGAGWGRGGAGGALVRPSLLRVCSKASPKQHGWFLRADEASSLGGRPLHTWRGRARSTRLAISDAIGRRFRTRAHLRHAEAEQHRGDDACEQLCSFCSWPVPVTVLRAHHNTGMHSTAFITKKNVSCALHLQIAKLYLLIVQSAAAAMAEVSCRWSCHMHASRCKKTIGTPTTPAIYYKVLLDLHLYTALTRGLRSARGRP